MEDLSDLPLLSEEDEKQMDAIKLPFGGLFGNTVLLRVIREITADPYREFRPKDLEVLASSSAPRIKNALEALVKQNLLENISRDPQRPVYKVNLASKRLVALTLLAYAVTDDRDGTDCMQDAIRHYYDEEIRDEPESKDGNEISISAEGAKGVRICMSDNAAAMLSEKLGEILEDACRRGEIKVQTP